MADPTPRNRWLALAGVRMAGAFGAMLGVVLIARGRAWELKVLGAALVLSALWMTASVTGALARRWRSGAA